MLLFFWQARALCRRLGATVCNNDSCARDGHARAFRLMIVHVRKRFRTNLFIDIENNARKGRNMVK